MDELNMVETAGDADAWWCRCMVHDALQPITAAAIISPFAPNCPRFPPADTSAQAAMDRVR
jgi:hypothetical protein